MEGLELKQELEVKNLADNYARRLMFNKLRADGLSNSQAKRTAQEAKPTESELLASRNALLKGLDLRQGLQFLIMEGTDEEKLNRIKDIQNKYKDEQKIIDEQKKHWEEERVRKSKRIQVNGLRGTNKQVAWALEIRAKVVVLHGGITDDKKTIFEELVNKIKSAKWWIEHRNLQLKQPYQNIAVEDFIKSQLGLDA